MGALVILVDGGAAGYLRRGERELLLFAPEVEPRRSHVTREVARMLWQLASARDEGHRGMLVADIDGEPASAHRAARLFVEQGFALTAMGLQARFPGTRFAGSGRGGDGMANTERDAAAETAQPQDNETRDTEHDRVRSSNDRDQVREREGMQTEHNRGYDEAVKGNREQAVDVDPDSPASDIDRDDSVTE